MFVKKAIITVTFALISALSIFTGVMIQKSYSEKYVQTSAALLYEKKTYENAVDSDICLFGRR